MYPGINALHPSHTLFVLDTPGVKALLLREVIRRQEAYPPHRNFTSPPSLWPSRELRKYHYRLYLSLPPSGAARIYRISFIARSFWKKEVMAHLRTGLTFRSYR